MGQRDRYGEIALGIASRELSRECEHGYRRSQLAWRWVDVMAHDHELQLPPEEMEEYESLQDR